jgi:polyhydroxyalkanoate synthesis regulator phasin
VVATQSRGRSGWRAFYEVGGGRAVVVRTKAIGGGGAMPSEETTKVIEQLRLKVIVKMLRAMQKEFETKKLQNIADTCEDACDIILDQRNEIDELKTKVDKLKAENAKLRGDKQ